MPRPWRCPSERYDDGRSGVNLHIDVVDDQIIVTLPLTSYTVTYYKPTNWPQLLAKRTRPRDAVGVSGPRLEGR